MPATTIEPPGTATTVDWVLTPLGPSLWGADSEVRLPGAARLPLRMTVMSLPDGTIALHSPIAPTPALLDAVNAKGPVRHIIAPSTFHHLHVAAWRDKFSEARLYAPPALSKKRPDLRIDEPLEGQAPASLSPILAGLTLQGVPALQEMVFLHLPSQSLLVADAFFNIVHPKGLATKFMLTLTGTRGKLAQSRLWNMFVKDKEGLAQSFRDMMKWNFHQLVPCHGEVIGEDAHAAVSTALHWR